MGQKAPKIEKWEYLTEGTTRDNRGDDSKDGEVKMKEEKDEIEKKDDVKADDNNKEEPVEGKSDKDKKGRW